MHNYGSCTHFLNFHPAHATLSQHVLKITATLSMQLRAHSENPHLNTQRALTCRAHLCLQDAIFRFETLFWDTSAPVHHTRQCIAMHWTRLFRGQLEQVQEKRIQVEKKELKKQALVIFQKKWIYFRVRYNYKVTSEVCRQKTAWISRSESRSPSSRDIFHFLWKSRESVTGHWKWRL